MKRRHKILIAIGTRPEAIKMAPVIRVLRARRDCETKVCLTGQHRDMLEQHLAALRILPDFELRLMRPNQDLRKLTSRILDRFDQVIASESPDWIVVQGDSTTAMAAGLAGYLRNVRVAHVEAGLRTWDNRDPFPEEVNRRITDLISSMHFAPTRRARQNLLREGVVRRSIVVTGNPVIDVLRRVRPKASKDLAGVPFIEKRVLVVTIHRRENFGEPLRRVCRAVTAIAKDYLDTVHIVVMEHRNPNVLSALRGSLSGHANISLVRPLRYDEFIWLLQRCYFVLTDSGGLQEECPSLGKPVIVLREKTERVELIEKGAGLLVGTHARAIQRAASALLDSPQAYRRMARIRNLYGDGKAADHIVAALLSR
jgi:UDP-N-acetylglucosamine 2-epimerase (non-hydrolysing)